MKYFYDWEFEETGKIILPISLGIVSEDNRHLYLINQSYFYWIDHGKANPNQWVIDNVLSHLTEEDIDKFGVSYIDIARIVLNFLSDNGRYTSRDEIELFAWYGAYDHVTLAQLWGPMINLPQPVPMFTREIEDFRRGQLIIPRNQDKYPEHHALYDALYQKELYKEWTKAKIEQRKDRTTWRLKKE